MVAFELAMGPRVVCVTDPSIDGDCPAVYSEGAEMRAYRSDPPLLTLATWLAVIASLAVSVMQ